MNIFAKKNMKKGIRYGVGLVLLIGSIFLANYIVDSRTPPPSTTAIDKPLAIGKTVWPETVTISIPSNGILTAKSQVSIFSEVQGLMEQGARDFKTGQRFKKGEILLKVNKDEFQASVQAAKSSFYTLLASVMPDLSLDYPEAYPKWKAYFDAFDLKKRTPPLPAFGSDGEKYFLVGRQLLNNYYSLRNLETRLSKFTLYAPFTGIVTGHNINSGALVRQGQLLGRFIKEGNYEVNLSLAVAFVNSIAIGQTVNLKVSGTEMPLEGKISRINAAIDSETQTVAVTVDIAAEGVKEGLFVTANIQANSIADAYEIPRTLLIQDDQVFTIQKDSLVLNQVERIYYTDESVIIKGLVPGSQLLIKPVIGAYQGMKVNASLPE